MSTYVFSPLPQPSLSIEGNTARFPVARVFCLGRNYRWPDATQGEVSQREAPFFFMKPSYAVIPAEGELTYPRQTQEFCPEIELVIAIGTEGVNISVDDALEHVWGYAAGLDLTRRDLQMAAKELGRPWEGSKAFEGSAPMSAIVPVSKIGHPKAGAIWLKVNDIDRQRSDLGNQIWSVAEVISHISQFVYLNAGDLIMTGTPPGVEGIKPGDKVTAGIDHVGQISVSIKKK